MSRTEVFDPAKEISKLKERVAQLEQQLQHMQERMNKGAVYGPYSGTWVAPQGPSDWPIGYDGKPITYKLGE